MTGEYLKSGEDSGFKTAVEELFNLLIKAGKTSQEAYNILFFFAHEGDIWTEILADVKEEYDIEWESKMIWNRFNQVVGDKE